MTTAKRDTGWFLRPLGPHKTDWNKALETLRKKRPWKFNKPINPLSDYIARLHCLKQKAEILQVTSNGERS